MTNRQLPFSSLVWCGLVFLAAFMPWGTVGFVSAHFFGFDAHTIITGWNGSVTLLGVLTPNWTVVVAAGLIALLALRQSQGLPASSALIRLLALYGVIHAGVCTFSLKDDTSAQLGLGSLITLVSFLALLFSKTGNGVGNFWKMSNDAKPATGDPETAS